VRFLAALEYDETQLSHRCVPPAQDNHLPKAANDRVILRILTENVIALCGE